MSRFRRRTALAAAVGGVLALATVASAGAVANGKPVPEGTYRFAAKLTFTGIPRTDGTTYDSACSGALVAPRWVVTAGHCFHDAARNRISGPLPYATSTVLVGSSTDDGNGGVERSILDVQQAPNGADVALARLDRPVGGIRPLTVSDRTPGVGDVLKLAGWGATTADGPVSDQLNTGSFTVASVEADTLGVTGKLPKADTSACPYDSGAPYFRSSPQGPVLVAVESSGPDCPHSTPETTYRTDTLAAWIRTR